MLNDSLAGSTVGLEFAADVSRWMGSVTVDINFINAAFHVAQQGQFFASSFVQRCQMKQSVEH